MSDRNFNDFNNFDDDFDDDFEDDDNFLDASEQGVKGIGGDRDSAVLRPFIQEIEQIPPEHLANLLQMVRLFRQSVALAEQTARAEAQDSQLAQPSVLAQDSQPIQPSPLAQDSQPIQPTVLPPVEPIEPTPTNEAPADSEVPRIDPIDRLLRRSQFESSSDRRSERGTNSPTESPQEPPLIPLRLPRTSKADIDPAADSTVEYVVKPAPEDESDWDELMDFLDQDNPKDLREEDDARDNDWDEYFRPSP